MYFGINTEFGLERLLGKKHVLDKIISIFVNEYKDGRKQIEEKILEKDKEILRKYLHTMKGAAGNISAENLHKLLIRVEQRLKENEDVSDEIDDVIRELEIVLSNKVYFENIKK